MQHPVNTEFHDFAVALRPSEHIVSVVDPHKIIRRKAIDRAIMLQFLFFVCRIPDVLKLDGILVVDGVVQKIHSIVHTLIRGFGLDFNL